MFNNIQSSTKKSKSIIKPISLVLILSLGMTFIYFAISSFALLSDNITRFQRQTREKMRFQVVDNYFGDDERIFFDSKDNIIRLKQMYNALTSDERYDFVVSTIQPIGVKNFSGSEKFKNMYERGIHIEDVVIDGEEYSIIKSLQYNRELLESYNLSLSDGRYPQDDEYTYNREASVPILLGSDYKGTYYLGDTIELDYIGLRIRGAVIGFLEEDEYIFDQDSIVYLNRFLLIPSLNFDGLPNDKLEKGYQLRIYLQKVNGTIETNTLNANDLQKIINEITYNSNLKAFSVIGANNINLSILNMQANELFVISSLIGSLIIIYIISLVSSLVEVELRTNTRRYAIELLCGMSLMRLRQIIIIKILIFVSMALMISLFSIYMINGYLNHISILILSSFIISVIVSIKPLTYVGNINIAQEIRRRI